MERLQAGTKVYLKHKGIYYPRFFVGYNAEGLPVCQFPIGDKGTTGYIAIQERRLYTVEEVEGLTDGPK